MLARRRRFPLALLALAAALGGLPAGAEPDVETVHLKNGGLLRGEVLRKQSDRVVLDLGFTIVSVPMDAVDRIVAAEGEPSEPGEAVPAVGRVYAVEPSRAQLTVEENMDRCAEAVLQVRTSIGLGSGFAIHPEGYLVTNHHVIAGEHDFVVTLFEQGERELRKVQFEDVRIVAMNPHVDLALLKIEDLGGRTLPSVPLGDSNALAQGQTVFSVGSPLGFDRTVSQGIVSLKNRPLGGHLYIQSTAQINPGNSGGPLFNLRGEVVGVNNMKIGAAGIEGLSFSIPSETLKSFLDNLDAFAFDASNPNAGFRYNRPPGPTVPTRTTENDGD